MSRTNLRLLAAQIINEVQNGRSLSTCLSSHLNTLSDARDRAWVQAICYGVCRFYTRLQAALTFLLKKAMKKTDADVYALLLVGLYQIIYMRIPAHAAVSETVSAAAALKKSWARGFVNAILREYLRKQAQIDKAVDEDETAFYAHPTWWIDAIKKAWPNDWQRILTANNAHPPFAIRINRKRISREQYLQALKAQDQNAEIIPETQDGVMLESPIPVNDLPGFSAGLVSIQDGAAQLAAELLDLAPQQTVLDACAAPGGKLTHILELQPNLIACVALDSDPERIQSIQENLARLTLQAECICADANDVSSWWNGKLFDRILIDAPCSASGVIRRHPDIKLLRKPHDIAAFAKEQLQLLTSLWPLLKPGGLLVYATCSLFPQENAHVLQHFLTAHADAKEAHIHATWGLACKIGRQILPGMHNLDGFYYARLVKGI